MSAREQFKKIKKQSIAVMILGVIVTIFGYCQYQDADKGLGTLDQMVLGESKSHCLKKGTIINCTVGPNVKLLKDLCENEVLTNTSIVGVNGEKFMYGSVFLCSNDLLKAMFKGDE